MSYDAWLDAEHDRHERDCSEREACPRCERDRRGCTCDADAEREALRREVLCTAVRAAVADDAAAVALVVLYQELAARRAARRVRAW